MNYRYTYFRYGSQGHASEPRYGDSEHYVWEPGAEFFRGSFSNWIGTSEEKLRMLPWIGAASVGLGFLIILFPMLLVMAVAGVFFFAGAMCFGLWWHTRERGGRAGTGFEAWNRAKQWLRRRLD